MPYYKNIEEIERDIEILKLKNQIEEEKLKLRWFQIKEDLAPKNLFQNFISGASKSISAFQLLNSFLRKRRKR